MHLPVVQVGGGVGVVLPKFLVVPLLPSLPRPRRRSPGPFRGTVFRLVFHGDVGSRLGARVLKLAALEKDKPL